MSIQKGDFSCQGLVNETGKNICKSQQRQRGSCLSMDCSEQTCRPADQHTSLMKHFRNLGIRSSSQGFSSSSILASSDTEEQVFPGDNKVRTELQNITYCTLLKDYTGRREKNSMLLLCHFTAQDNNLPEVLGRGRNRKYHWNRVESGPAWGFTSYLL